MPNAIANETPLQLRTEAIVGPADVVSSRQLIASMKGPVEYLDGSRRKTTRAERLRGLWEAEGATIALTSRSPVDRNRYIFNRLNLSYLWQGKQLEQPLVKAGAEAVVLKAQAEINRAALALQQGKIDVDEFYAAMKQYTKLGHMAQAALARGGFDEVRPGDWRPVEEIVYRNWVGVPGKGKGRFPGLRRFALDVVRGRYGVARPAVLDAAGKILSPASTLSSMVTNRAGQYALSLRSTYENTRLLAHAELGFTFATRIPGVADHCATCQQEGNVKRPIDEVVEIGDSECNVRCHCTIVFSSE